MSVSSSEIFCLGVGVKESPSFSISISGRLPCQCAADSREHRCASINNIHR